MLTIQIAIGARGKIDSALDTRNTIHGAGICRNREDWSAVAAGAAKFGAGKFAAAALG